MRCFLALDKALAYARHYPAINWTISYSEYYEDLDPWYIKNVGPEFCALRGRLLSLLSEESKLMEIVKLIGSDVLPDSQKLTIEIARAIRTGFLQQNAFHKDDTYVPLVKQMKMMEVILYLQKTGAALVAEGIPMRALLETGLFERLVKMKYDVPNDRPELFQGYYTEIDDAAKRLRAEHIA